MSLLVSLAFLGCQSAPPKITIQDAHVEFSKAMKDEAAVFLKIVNKGGADKLVGVKVSIPGAMAHIHKMSGTMMTIVKEFDIPANSDINFRSGASHIMIMNLPDDVSEGTSFTLTMNFEKSGAISVPLTFNTPRPKPAMSSMK
ncbi:MAG: copper chaperone PCu(A)C [Deltaproteobacteria bacterium]